MHTIAHRMYRHCKRVCTESWVGEKSPAAPENRTRVGSVAIQCSTNWATPPPIVLSGLGFCFCLEETLYSWRDIKFPELPNFYCCCHFVLKIFFLGVGIREGGKIIPKWQVKEPHFCVWTFYYFSWRHYKSRNLWKEILVSPQKQNC